MKYVIYVSIILLIILVSCGSVRSNLKQCKADRDMYKKAYHQSLLREKTYQMIADSLQVEIWNLQSTLDSVNNKLRTYLDVYKWEVRGDTILAIPPYRTDNPIIDIRKKDW